jgi:hypothetical protein
VEADRVLIIQPHPPHDKHLISATLEAPRKGTASAKPHIKNIEMVFLWIKKKRNLVKLKLGLRTCLAKKKKHQFNL